MTRLSLAVWLCVVVCGLPVAAQDAPKYELGAGYAYMSADTSLGGFSLPHGFDVSLARNLNGWLAIVGDGGGYHAEGFRLATAQAGPRFTARTGRHISLFAQVLAGLAHANAGARGFPAYHESVAWTIGGGVDWRISEHVSLRLVQTDYVQTRLGSGVQHNFRAVAGIVFHFGKNSAN